MEGFELPLFGINHNNYLQVAEREGRYLAKELSGPTDEPFKFTSAGMLAYIGKYEGLSDLPDFKLQGMSHLLVYAYNTVNQNSCMSQ